MRKSDKSQTDVGGSMWDAALEPKQVPFLWLVALGFGAMLAGPLLQLVLFRGVPTERVRARLWSWVAVGAASAAIAIVLHLRASAHAWDEAVSASFAAWNPYGLTTGLADWLSFPVALVLVTFVLGFAIRARLWPLTYLVALSGLAFVSMGIAMMLVFPRPPPLDYGFFLGPSAFPGLTAGLWWMVGLLGFVAPKLGQHAPAWLPHLRWAVVVSPVSLVAGQTHVTGYLVGVALATSVTFTLALWIDRLAKTAMSPRAEDPLVRLGERLDGWILRYLWSGRTLVALIGLGICLRVVSYWWTPLGPDAYVYAAMADSLLESGTLTMPWGNPHTFDTAVVASHHYPPLFPAYLAGFYALLGVSAATTHVASIVSSLAALAVVWLCTRDLYGRPTALVVTAVIAINPLFVQNTGQGYSENLVMLLFTATLWAILKSLDRPWYIVAAGLFAGLGYLAKSSMGYFFIIAGLGGLAWRLKWRGWKVLRDPSYLAAILLFGLIVLSWMWRNWVLFGTWETSHHLASAYSLAMGAPGEWFVKTWVAFLFYLFVGYLLYLALLPWIPKLVGVPKLASEHDSGLWLALGLPLLLSSAIDAALWMAEGEFLLHNVRYIAFVAVPAAWLIVRHTPRPTRVVRFAAVASMALFLVACAVYARPSVSYRQYVGDDLGQLVEPGDSIDFLDSNTHGVYQFYFQLTQNGQRDVNVSISCATMRGCAGFAPPPEAITAEWVVMVGPHAHRLPPEYVAVSGTDAVYSSAYPEWMSLWHRGPLGADELEVLSGLEEDDASAPAITPL